MGELSNVTSNKDTITIKIYNQVVKYDHVIVSKANISKKLPVNTRDRNKLVINNDLSCGDCHIGHNRIPVFYVDGILAHYIVQELRISPKYRASFILKVNSFNSGTKYVIFKLVQPKKEIIDYSWNERTIYLAWERVELDHALSWLSTLGGAFSALGDYFENCALMAGKISFHQMKLAMRLGDPTVASRCRLYFSLSLIQQGHYKTARKIIETEYHNTKNATVVDIRLLKMCLGIWAKLKYEYSRHRKSVNVKK